MATTTIKEQNKFCFFIYFLV